MKIKPYPEYKDSGVEWIGKIPEGWENAKLKFLLNKITDGSHTSVEILSEGLPYVTVTDLDEKKEEIDLAECKKLSRKDFDFLVRNGCKPEIGDILFSQIGTIGLVIPVKKDNNFVMLSSLAILTPSQDIENRWIIHFLRSNFIKDQYKTMMAGGAVKRITLDHISNFRVLKPTITEQKSIFSFLDKKTSEIDLTIEKDTRLIELLKEKRTALINHVVTKGLDPTVKMKDSGVEWIGEIPEDWEVRRLKTVLKPKKNSIKTGPFGSQLKSSDMEDSEVKVYNQRNVLSKSEKIGENFVSNKKYEDLISFKVVPGDLLITTRGTIGKCLRLSNDAEEGLLHPCLMKINNNEDIILNKYLELILEDSDLVKIQFFLQSNATTIEVIYQENLKEIYLFIPPLSKQNEILDYLKSKTSKIDLTIEKIQQNIELFEEYKKSLIHHVVTGKVDVREVAV